MLGASYLTPCSSEHEHISGAQATALGGGFRLSIQTPQCTWSHVAFAAHLEWYVCLIWLPGKPFPTRSSVWPEVPGDEVS